MKYIILIAFFLMIIPMISASPDYTFKYGEDANFTVSCDIDGVPCDSALALCNFTLRDPNGNYVVDFLPMTVRNNGDINYTVGNNQLTMIGKEYPGKINCIQSGQNKTVTFTAMITPTGNNETVPTLFLILGLGAILTLIIGIKLENEYVGFISGILFIVAGIYAMVYGIGNLADMYTRAIAFACIGLGLMFELAAGYKVIIGILGEERAF